MKKQDFVNVMRHAQAPLKAMIEMVPEDKLDWRPADNFMSNGQLLHHFTENWGFLKMMVTKQFPDMGPEKMAEMMKLENMPSATKAEAAEAIEKDLENAVAFLEKEISEEDFFNQVISAPWGFEGPIWQAVMMMKEHMQNHKMQLHLYLKMLGVEVNTSTLYGM